MALRKLWCRHNDDDVVEDDDTHVSDTDTSDTDVGLVDDTILSTSLNDVIDDVHDDIPAVITSVDVPMVANERSEFIQPVNDNNQPIQAEDSPSPSPQPTSTDWSFDDTDWSIIGQ